MASINPLTTSRLSLGLRCYARGLPKLPCKLSVTGHDICSSRLIYPDSIFQAQHEPALFHALILATTALAAPLGPAHLLHLNGHAIEAINAALNDSRRRHLDAITAAIVVLASHEYSSGDRGVPFQAHLSGLQRLVAMRGGHEALPPEIAALMDLVHVNWWCDPGSGPQDLAACEYGCAVLASMTTTTATTTTITTTTAAETRASIAGEAEGGAGALVRAVLRRIDGLDRGVSGHWGRQERLGLVRKLCDDKEFDDIQWSRVKKERQASD